MAIMSSSGSNISRNLAIVKKYFKKPMTLVIAILSLVTLVSSFMLTVATNKIMPDLQSLATALGESTVETTTTTSANPLSFLISAVVTLCIFMIFVFSVTPNGRPTIWFQILHALSVIQLIINALAAILVVVLEIVFIFATPTLVNFLAGSGGEDAQTKLTPEQIESITRAVSSFRITLLIMLLVTIIIYGIYLYYVNAQTAFLKSVVLTCKNPMLKSKGAVSYGTWSLVFGVLALIGTVIFYLMVGNPNSSIFTDMDIDVPIDISFINKIVTPYLIYSVSSALYISLRGVFAKGWAAFAKENEDFVFESVGAGNRVSDASPMPTYKSSGRSSHEARQQSQPYLIGEEQDPNKKSSYIPEELQQDYSQEPQMYQQGGNPYGGAPYGNGGAPYAPQGGQPGFGGDPFAQADPFAQSPMGGSNPYGGQGGQGGGYNNGYNNGMM